MLNLVLLVGKVAFLVLLYLFVLMIVRSAVRDVWGAARREEQPGRGLERPMMERPPTGPHPAGAESAEARLVVEESPWLERGSVIGLPEGDTLVVGRDPRSGLHLADTFVSSRHARLHSYGDGLYVEDLGSTNGTFVNGKEIDAMTRLQPGHRLEIGDSVLRVEVA